MSGWLIVSLTDTSAIGSGKSLTPKGVSYSYFA
jgi:hypothetical protein